MKRPRTADPYRDTAVIDARAPRFNQATIGALSLVAVLVDWWPLFAILAGQLAIGLAFGRRFCLPCVAYFELVQPRLGEGPIEDARPPRFANLVGACVLTAAAVAGAVGASALSLALGSLVAALALLAAATGLCAGCEVYRLAARFRGIRRRAPERLDLARLGAPAQAGLVVSFTHPLCTDCRELERRLEAEGRRVVAVDVSRDPELARTYGVAVVPTAFEVGADGTVLARVAG